MPDPDVQHLKRILWVDVPNPRYIEGDDEPETFQFTPVGWRRQLEWSVWLDLAIAGDPLKDDDEGDIAYTTRVLAHRMARGEALTNLTQAFREYADPDGQCDDLMLSELTMVINAFFGQTPQTTAGYTTDRLSEPPPTSTDATSSSESMSPTMDASLKIG